MTARREPVLIDDPLSDAFRRGRDAGRDVVAKSEGDDRALRALLAALEEAGPRIEDPLHREEARGTASLLREHLGLGVL